MNNKLNKILRILNWMAIAISTVLVFLYIGASLYKAGRLGESVIYIAIFTAPFLFVPLLTIWALKKALGRVAVTAVLLTNLILLLINLAGSYLTYIEDSFHASNPQIYGNSENWFLVTFIVSTPLILLSANIIALIILLINSKRHSKTIIV